MTYHIKRDSYWRIPLIIILILYLVATTQAATIDETSAAIHKNAIDDKHFVYYTFTEVTGYIKYVPSTSWNVNSTDITWRERVGDCSEFALLYQQMLSPYIRSAIVWGVMPDGRLHDDVKIYEENNWYMIDSMDEHGFVEKGFGLHPDERIVYS